MNTLPLHQRWCTLASFLLILTAGCSLGRPWAELRLERGDVALADRNLDVALAEFQEAVKLDPMYAPGHYRLAMAHKEMGNLEAAADALQEAVRLDPSEVEPIFQLGEVYRLLKRSTQAIRAYLMACDLDPRSFDMRFRLATCYHQSGDLEAAIDNYRESINLSPRSAAARSNLGAALAAQGNDYEAIKAYKESLECEGAQPVVLVNLATVYLKQERWTTAQRTLSTALKMDPDLAVAHERIGYALWRVGELEPAAESYRRAIDLDPQNAAALAGYGVVLMTQYLENPAQVSLRDEAVESWHRSLEANPNQPKLRTLVEKYRPKSEEPVINLGDDWPA
jgi:tetratricopeptide (TPR) repeat protein